MATAVALALLAAVAVAGIYLHQLDATVSANIRHAPLLAENGPAWDVGTTRGADLAATGARNASYRADLGSDAQQSTQAMTILLVGSDERPGEERARSDVVILAHLDAARQKVYLIHFPRDMYVPIPGRRGRDRINAAYRYGGVPLLAATIRALTGVRIDHAAQIDFERFRAMTDAVGGVDVTVEEGSTKFPRGTLHLDGQRALEFVRERKMLSRGDISRGRREQAFVRALMLKALSRETLSDPMRFMRFVKAATTNLTVDDDFSIETMRSEALRLRGLRSQDVIFLTAPLGRFFTTTSGAMVIDSDQAALNRLGRAVSTDRLADYLTQQ